MNNHAKRGPVPDSVSARSQRPEAAGQAPEEREASPAELEATLLHKSAEQRGKVARQIQRRLGNRHTQRVVERARRAADPYRATSAHADLPVRGAAIVQRTMAGSFPTSFGGFDMDMQTQEGAVPGTGPSGLTGTIKFLPDVKAPYSNKIALTQIVKLTDGGGSNVDPASMPAASGPSLRTKEDAAGGVEGGFFTDVLHNDFTNGNVVAPAGSNLPAQYPFGPGGGPQVTGFKRSDNLADIKAAELFDAPGTTSPTGRLDFSFETVARGDDVQQTYGSVKWAFSVDSGKVVDEKGPTVTDAQSATFDAALDKHRDFYTHEPLTFYFEFDSRDLTGGEVTKINPEVLDYLARNSDTRLTLTGRADMLGNAAYNRQLSADRIEAVRTALIGAGIDGARINATTPADIIGATTDQTTDAVTPQVGDPNRRGNRSVIVTFERTATPAPAGP
jgi:outer membrane protein OmpA-like peptidoglycan-associated protein